ncbi:hypothetical protein GQ54DRAFT_295321 [Martensiomyces pterosporus]|nr:hypothetical protein GQ54DRAFT_295321 [Martensiomyces pterosporus]
MDTHKRRTSKLSLEPNPFERSFSLARSEDVISSGSERQLQLQLQLQQPKQQQRTAPTGDTSRPSDEQTTTSNRNMADSKSLRQSGAKDDDLRGIERPSSTPPEVAVVAVATPGAQAHRLTLPPVTAINSPLGMANMSTAWGPDSLRSGPLSPAMLGGPATPAARPKTTSRLGMTDPTLHTGLTPFLAGEPQPMVASGEAAVGLDGAKPMAASMASPGIQALIRAAATGRGITTTPGGTLHIAPTPGPQPAAPLAERQQQTQQPVSSQAHEKLSASSEAAHQHTAREPSPSAAAVSLSTMPKFAQGQQSQQQQQRRQLPSHMHGSHAQDNDTGAATNAPPTQVQQQMMQSVFSVAPARPAEADIIPATAADNDGGAGSKRRKIEDASNEPLPEPSMHTITIATAAVAKAAETSEASAKRPPARAKRAGSSKGAAGTRTPAGAAKKDVSRESSLQYEDSAGSEAENAAAAAGSTAQGNDLLTEEEKRKQFLERNRIAALKCRQRKKKQLKELQDRHDFVVYENDRLKAEYMQLRDCALQIKMLLDGHRECPVAQSNGVFGIDNLPVDTPNISSQPLLFALPDGMQSEQLKDMIDAIPPTSNGIPINNVDPVTGKPFIVSVGAQQQQPQLQPQLQPAGIANLPPGQAAVPRVMPHAHAHPPAPQPMQQMPMQHQHQHLPHMVPAQAGQMPMIAAGLQQQQQYTQQPAAAVALHHQHHHPPPPLPPTHPPAVTAFVPKAGPVQTMAPLSQSSSREYQQNLM